MPRARIKGLKKYEYPISIDTWESYQDPLLLDAIYTSERPFEDCCSCLVSESERESFDYKQKRTRKRLFEIGASPSNWSDMRGQSYSLQNVYDEIEEMQDQRSWERAFVMHALYIVALYKKRAERIESGETRGRKRTLTTITQ